MKKYLFIYAVVATAVIILGGKYLFAELDRLQNNNDSLATSVTLYRTQADEAAASVQALRLRIGEYEELRAADAAKIKSMGLKIRRLESAAKSATTTAVTFSAPLVDSVIVRDTLLVADTISHFSWSDSWTTVKGIVLPDSVSCSVTSVDTLHQVVYRVPRRFLFIRYGTKALRQHIVSSNPHTKVVYPE